MTIEEPGPARYALRRYRADLIAQVRRRPRDLEARRALAESYREHGDRDQAGRWGMLVPGGSTARERELFARTVARTGEASLNRVRRLLLVPVGTPLESHDPEGVFVGFAEVLEREAKNARKQDTTPLSLGEIVGVVLLTLATIAIIGGWVLYAVAFFSPDPDSMRLTGRVISVITVSVVLLELAIIGVVNVRAVRRHARGQRTAA